MRTRVTPNARKNAAEGLRGDRLLLRIKAPPVEGKANQAAQKWLANLFQVRSSQVQLVKGQKSRDKDWLIEDLQLSAASNTLNQLLDA